MKSVKSIQTKSPTSSSACPGLHRSGFPDAPFPPQDIYERLGEQKIAAIIRRQHDLMWQSEIQSIFGSDEVRFQKTVIYTIHYFIEMLGGPKLFTPQRGEPKLGRRHRHLQLTPLHRTVWLGSLRQALQEQKVPNDIAHAIWQWVEPLSMRFLTPRIEAIDLAREHLIAAKDYD